MIKILAGLVCLLVALGFLWAIGRHLGEGIEKIESEKYENHYGDDNTKT